MKYTAILLDDEFASSEVLQYEINKLAIDIEIIGIFQDPVEGLMAIKKYRPNLIFLDIEMPRLNGFEVLDLLGDNHDMKIIFVTAYNTYAVDAFKYYAIDYLVKPVSPERLKKAVEMAISRSTELPSKAVTDLTNIFEKEISISSNIVVPISSGFQVIKINDILRCEADNNYTHIYLTDGSHIIVSKSLIHFEKMLVKATFLRVHQSHLVNMQYVNKYLKTDGGFLLLQDGSNIPVSRHQKSKMNTYFRNKSI